MRDHAAIRPLLALVMLSAAAMAAPPPITLTVDPCVGVPLEGVRAALEVELGGRWSDAATSALGPTRVDLRCEGALVVLRIEDPITGKTLSRSIDPGAQAGVRGRVLALAITELLRASWIELEVNPRPAVAPAGATAPPAARKAALDVATARGPFDRMRLYAFGGGQVFLSEGVVFGGGAGLRLLSVHLRRLAWMVDVKLDHAATAVSLGQITSDTLSIGTAVGLHTALRRAALTVGLGMRGGAVRFEGLPDARPGRVGRTHWGAWGGPLATALLEIAPLRRLALSFAVEVGYVVAPVGALVGPRREAAVDGPWIGFQLGAGVFL